jgi:hypothetical protein
MKRALWMLLAIMATPAVQASVPGDGGRAANSHGASSRHRTANRVRGGSYRPKTAAVPFPTQGPGRITPCTFFALNTQELPCTLG